jgi:hypothetical protein
MTVIIFVVVLASGGIIGVYGIATAQRRKALMIKYNDALVVEMIMAKRIWQGMTKEQLIDSWGQPKGHGERVMKTKRSETFKYNQTGRNRFRSRVMLENGTVIGWQEK